MSEYPRSCLNGHSFLLLKLKARSQLVKRCSAESLTQQWKFLPSIVSFLPSNWTPFSSPSQQSIPSYLQPFLALCLLLQCTSPFPPLPNLRLTLLLITVCHRRHKCTARLTHVLYIVSLEVNLWVFVDFKESKCNVCLYSKTWHVGCYYNLDILA